MISFQMLPMVNACLNFTSGVLLTGGWVAIKNKRRDIHTRFMIAALIASTLFLISYLTYHAVHGTTHYQGQGILRPIYFAILLTHTPLAAIIVPFCIAAIYHAARGNFIKHTRITKWLLPVWLYVSVTGVIIYLMLYRF